MPNTGFTMTNNTTNNRWDLTYTVDSAGTRQEILNTAGTFLDKNIAVNVVIPNNLTATLDGINLITSTLSSNQVGSNENDKAITYSSVNNSGIQIIDTINASATITATSSNSAYSQVNSNLVTDTISNSLISSQFIKEIKITPPSSGTREFGITIPNGNTTDYITLVFHIDSSGNVTIDNQYNLIYS